LESQQKLPGEARLTLVLFVGKIFDIQTDATRVLYQSDALHNPVRPLV